MLLISLCYSCLIIANTKKDATNTLIAVTVSNYYDTGVNTNSYYETEVNYWYMAENVFGLCLVFSATLTQLPKKKQCIDSLID